MSQRQKEYWRRKDGGGAESNQRKEQQHKPKRKSKTKSPPKFYDCDICKSRMSFRNKEEHLNGKNHLKNVGRHRRSKQQQNKSNSNGKKQRRNIQIRSESNHYYCDICKMKMDLRNNGSPLAHLNGKKHRRNRDRLVEINQIMNNEFSDIWSDLSSEQEDDDLEEARTLA
eukprot:355242_1